MPKSNFYSNKIMVSSKVVIYVAIILFLSVQADKLPDFIKICSRSDPKLNECMLNSARDAIPHLLKGYKPLNIPPLNPLKLTSLQVETGPNLKLSLKDVTIYGVDGLEVKDVQFDLVNKNGSLNLYGKELKLDGIYDITGQILVLPITGTGPINIRMVDANFIFNFDWGVKDKDGVAYGVILNETLTYTTKRSYYKLDNLFNGDKVLGDNMNKVLNENWEEVNKELAPSVSYTIDLIVHRISDSILNTVPFDNILSP